MSKTTLSKKPAMRAIDSKIKAGPALVRLLALARKKKKKVVFTNGCFDLLHKGHVTYLERAQKLGDILVVALNSDESVRRIKGPERPINPLADRLDVLAALESVDYVTWFEQDTPLELIRKLKPQILVKGGDWRAEQIVGGADVVAAGGKVKSLPFVEGRSTTRLIAKARASMAE
jgi:rfaE bifunctional protein nucleotidyltransferase chain/domain